jgi:hypothetical protein
VKRLLVLLLVLAAGVAAAALAVPTHAATVNGAAISQESLNSDVNAIAGSAAYQCYLNSQEYLSSGGDSELPPVLGAGTGQNPGDRPTATSAFVASYLDTEIGHQLVLQLAAAHNVTVTAAELTDARASLEGQITSVMTEILQTSEAQNPKFTCSVTGQPLTGAEVLSTLPASFVDQQVQFVATASALQEDLAGIGSSDADLQRYYEAHRSAFDTACFTVAVYSTQADAQAAAAQVASGTPFSQVASAATQGGPQGCDVLSDIAAKLPSSARIDSLPTGTVSAPIDDDGTYFLLQITSRSTTPYARARSYVSNVVQRAGSAATQKVLTAAERHASVHVNPQYGAWVPATATVFTPFTPPPSDVLNAPANEPAVSTASATPSSG